MKKSPLRLLILILAGFLVLLIALKIQYPQKQPSLPVIFNVTDFELTDSTDHPFASTQLKGKVWVAHFFFTSCSGMCPITTNKLAALYRSYKIDKRVAFVSISVNPANDTPAVLTQYALRYNADPQQWHFLTGPDSKIQDISEKVFKVGTVDEPVFHSGYFILVDKQGRVRGYYDGMDNKGTPQLFRDIAFLLKEKS